MMNSVRLFTLLGVTLAVLLHAPSAHAQLGRTWVVNSGDDSNPCSRIAPCRTFQGAISKTASGGEIDVIDAQGYGTVNITKSITIDGGNGQGASLTAPGVNGIIINTANVVVTLRNLRINGLGNSSQDGIQFKQGTKLIIENCDVYGFTNGVNIAPPSNSSKIVIINSRFFNNTNGGIQVKPTGGTTTVTVREVAAVGNEFGIGVDTTSGGNASVMVAQSNISENTGNGIQVTGTGAVMEISNSEIQHNSVGVNITAPSDVRSFKNNIIAQNPTNVTGNLVAATPQ